MHMMVAIVSPLSTTNANDKDIAGCNGFGTVRATVSPRGTLTTIISITTQTMQVSLTQYDNGNGVTYSFNDNVYNIHVPPEHIDTAEQRIADFFAKRSNTLQFSDIATYTRKTKR